MTALRARSPIGIGTYLGPDDDETDALYTEAIARALDAGIDVIDTSINYRSQRSERVIGAVLREAIAAGRLRREDVLVASKAGYVPYDGKRPYHYPTYVEATYLRPGIIPWDELVNGSHCMAPRFLLDQIDRSRRNLGLDTIDIYYLHNPESGMEDIDPGLFRARVRNAFAAFEQAVSDGKIGCYGVATWHGLRKAPGHAPHQSLAEFAGLAREVAGDAHHLKVVQLPYNLALIEAFAADTQEMGDRLVPLLQCAADLGIHVFCSAPLLQGQLAEGLPEHLRAALGLRTDPQRAVQFVRSTPGVGTTLVGMKRAAHVDEAIEVMRAPPLAAEAIRALFVED